MRAASRSVLRLALALLVPLSAAAVPTSLTTIDLPTCDVLSTPATAEELGLSPAFPVGSRITTASATTTGTACASVVDNGLIPNIRLSITNSNSVSFSSLWYVANVGTVFTNIDGTINGMSAFKIDAVGTNTPLASGDTNGNTLFDPGETWQFVIQDYTNVTLAATAINAIGVPDLTASGNILGVPVPEPGTAALIGLGLVALGARRRAQV
jgi:hypothetical protein